MTTNYRKNKKTGQLEGSFPSPASPPPAPMVPAGSLAEEPSTVSSDSYAGIAEVFAARTGKSLITLETRRCRICNETGTVTVETDQLEDYNNGAMIQNAFPDLSPGEREQLMTGIHPDCWDKTFAYLEDEDDYDDGVDGAGEAEALSS